MRILSDISWLTILSFIKEMLGTNYWTVSPALLYNSVQDIKKCCS